MNQVMIEEVAEFFKILSEPVRLGLLLDLKERERTVSELAVSVGTSNANVSKHLMMMRKSGLLGRRKAGNQVFYCLKSQGVFEVCDFICRDIRSRLEYRRSAIEVPAAGFRTGTGSGS